MNAGFLIEFLGEIFFFLLSSQLSRQTRAETLAMQASVLRISTIARQFLYIVSAGTGIMLS